MHITITGNLGSGKSTVAKILSEKYGFELYSTGKFQREIAEKMGLSTLEMNKLMLKDNTYDFMIDEAVTKTAKNNPNKDILFDSRLAWYFVPNSFKVFVTVDSTIAASRVMNDSRGNVEKYNSVSEARTLLKARAEAETNRYKKIYGIDYFDFSNYDFICNSNNTPALILAEEIYENAKKHFEPEQ